MSKREKRTKYQGDEMRRMCDRCGVVFGLHGATPPHDRGDECSGFVEPSAAMKERG